MSLSPDVYQISQEAINECWLWGFLTAANKDNDWEPNGLDHAGLRICYPDVIKTKTKPKQPLKIGFVFKDPYLIIFTAFERQWWLKANSKNVQEDIICCTLRQHSERTGNLGHELLNFCECLSVTYVGQLWILDQAPEYALQEFLLFFCNWAVLNLANCI